MRPERSPPDAKQHYSSSFFWAVLAFFIIFVFVTIAVNFVTRFPAGHLSSAVVMVAGLLALACLGWILSIRDSVARDNRSLSVYGMLFEILYSPAPSRVLWPIVLTLAITQLPQREGLGDAAFGILGLSVMGAIGLDFVFERKPAPRSPRRPLDREKLRADQDTPGLGPPQDLAPTDLLRRLRRETDSYGTAAKSAARLLVSVFPRSPSEQHTAGTKLWKSLERWKVLRAALGPARAHAEALLWPELNDWWDARRANSDVEYRWSRFREGRRGSLVLRRLIDLPVAGIGLAIVVFFMVPLAVWYTVTGRRDAPFVVTSHRVGLWGARFRKYTFAASSYAYTRRDGIRRRIARALVLSRFEHLPILLNVIKGDMSLVGPAPLYVSEYKLLLTTYFANDPSMADRLIARLALAPGYFPYVQVHRLFEEGQAGRQAWIEEAEMIASWSLRRDVILLYRSCIGGLRMFVCGLIGTDPGGRRRPAR